MDTAEKGIPDEQLASAALKGDDAAYEELVRRHKRAVLAVAARIAHDDLEIDEISQEVFVKAHGSLKSFRGAAPFGHWLMRIAANACRDVLRKRKSRPVAVPLEKVEYRLEGASVPEGAAEEIEALRRAMEKLPADDRLLLTMLELEGKRVKDVAYILNISEGNVKVRAHRARKALKELFGKEVGGS